MRRERRSLEGKVGDLERRQVIEGKSGQDTNKLQVQGVGIRRRSESRDGGGNQGRKSVERKPG